MGTSSAVRGDGFLAQRLERAFDLVLRRRIGMRDWLLAVVVVSVAQITGVNAIGWLAYGVLFVVALTALALWFFVFPRLEPRGALRLEAWMNACTPLAAAFLVAASNGPESPYVFFYALPIVFVAAFVERESLRVALIGISVVCALAPIAYDWDEAVSSDFIPAICVAVAVWIVSSLLIAWKRTSAINAELEARRLSYVDPLTLAANRRGLEQYAGDVAAQDARYAVVLVNVGGVEEINRTLGHFAGDESLRRVVKAMRDASFDIDQVARLEGTEFAVLLPGADRECAERWRGRFHERLEIANAAAEAGARVAASAGVATSDEAGSGLAGLLSDAEAASEPVAERGGATASPIRTAERAERLRSRVQLEEEEETGERTPVASVDLPTGLIVSLPAAALLGAVFALTGGASSALFSLAILLVAYVATFGTRMQTLIGTLAMLGAGLGAVLANTPVSNADQTRALTIFVTLAVLADTIQRNSRKLTVAERRTAELSLVDPLTGLGNRTAFERGLKLALPRSASASQPLQQRLEGPPALIALELEDFQQIRARLGHAAADLTLLEVAEALRDALGDEGAVFRVGGAEFAAIVHSHHLQHVDALGARCADALRELEEGGRQADAAPALDFRIGGAVWSPGMSAAELVAAATAAERAETAPVIGFAPVAG